MKGKAAEQASFGRRGRRSTESEGRALIDAWQTSGLSVAEFCRHHGIATHWVHYWKRRLVGASSTNRLNVPTTDTPEFFAVDLVQGGLDSALEEGSESSISIWASPFVRIELPAAASRDRFIRALRWTIEATQS